MSIKYECWTKEIYGVSGKAPLNTFYVLDSAIKFAEKESKGVFKTSYHKYDKNKPFDWGTTKEIELPCQVMVLEKGGVKTEVRGFGIGGKWHYAKTCLRCKGDGLDQITYNLPCVSCSGAGYKPKN